MKIFPLYHKATGLNTLADQERINYDVETGVLGLSEAENVNIDLSGAIRRRAGYTKLQTGLCHSLFSCGAYGYCVLNGDLCYIDSTLAIKIIKSIGNFKVAYAAVFDGSDNRVFYTNGITTGILYADQVYTWEPSPYVGVDSIKAQITEYMPVIPPGQLLKIHNGRMYIAKRNMLYVSEPYAYSWFDEKAAFIFDKPITMLQGVLGGVFVATNNAVYFLAGPSPQEFSLVKAYDYGAIEGTDQVVTATTLNLETQGDVIIFTSTQGICLGMPMGIVLNFTKTFIDFPEVSIGASLINTDNRYITTLI